LKLTYDGFISLYRSLEISIIPVGKDKKPLVKWEEYQNRPPTNEELTKWFLEPAEKPNVAVVCGKISGGLVILDFENEEDFKTFFKDDILKQTMVVKTPHGGVHVWLRETGEVPRRSIRICEDPALDLLGEGGYALAPPSIIDHSKCDKNKCNRQGVSEYEVISTTFRPLEVKSVYQAVLERAKSLGWKLKEKPRVDEILQGVPEGMRNNSAFAYARYLLFKVKLDPQTVWAELQRWNGLNNPPLDERELRTVWESAQRYPYVSQKAEAQAQEATEVDQKALEIAEKILVSENVLEALKKECLDHIIVGEDKNKLLMVVLLLSGPYSKVERKITQIIMLGGQPGVGKSELASLSRAFKVKEVGRFTAHAIDYTDLSNHEVLYIKELAYLDAEKEGVATIKFLSTEDQGYVVEYVVRDDKGRLTTETKMIPPITVVTTTTRVLVDSQFERRAWIINPDESNEQTRRILEFKAQLKVEEQLVKLGQKACTSKEFAFQVLKALVGKLEPVKVIIPYPRTLARLLNVEVLRTRGDYDKLYALTLLTAFLLQKKLPRDNGVVLALPSTLLHALDIAAEPLNTMSTRLDARIRALIQELRALGKVNADDVVNHEDRIKLAKRLGRDEKTVRNYLKKMVEEGYMVEEPDPVDKRYINHRLMKGLDDIVASTSGLKYGNQSGNRDFPLSIFLDAFNETVEFIKENCGKYWGDGKALADALKAEILQHVQDDKARLTTLAVLSTIFDHHEVENVEMEKSGFHISFHNPTVQETNSLDILDKKDNLTKICDKGSGLNMQGQSIDTTADPTTKPCQNVQDDKAKDTKDEPALEQDTIPKPFENSETYSKLYRYKTCKCGPWRTLEMAREHARLMPGHEIEEVEG
jgi:DNA-binding MarR family transcriptional regulator